MHYVISLFFVIIWCFKKFLSMLYGVALFFFKKKDIIYMNIHLSNEIFFSIYVIY